MQVRIWTPGAMARRANAKRVPPGRNRKISKTWLFSHYKIRTVLELPRHLPRRGEATFGHMGDNRATVSPYDV
jgi:hypothetical protein